MNICYLLLTAIILLALSGLPGCLLSARSAVGQRIATALMLIGSVLGLVSVSTALCAPHAPSLSLAWSFQHSRFTVVIDPLSALFLIPVFIVPALGAIYGLGYWKQADHPANGQRLGLSYGLLAGAMAFVVIARDGMLFIIVWEIMALAAYFAATAEDDKPEVRRAGWIYLIATCDDGRQTASQFF
jgi:hydrogenase-4 component B